MAGGTRIGLLITHALAACLAIAIFGSFIWIFGKQCWRPERAGGTSAGDVIDGKWINVCSNNFKAIWSLVFAMAILHQIMGWVWFCVDGRALSILYAVCTGCYMVFLHSLFSLEHFMAIQGKMAHSFSVIGYAVCTTIMILIVNHLLDGGDGRKKF